MCIDTWTKSRRPRLSAGLRPLATRGGIPPPLATRGGIPPRWPPAGGIAPPRA
jgi:hypothetical protein